MFRIHSHVVTAKRIGSPGKNDRLLFHSKLFKCHDDHYKVLSVIMTITVRSTVAFGNARITL